MIFIAVVLVTTSTFQSAGKALGAFLLSVSRQGVIFAIVIFLAQKLLTTMASWLLRRFQIVSQPFWRQCFCSGGYIRKREVSFKRNIAKEKNICYTVFRK